MVVLLLCNLELLTSRSDVGWVSGHQLQLVVHHWYGGAELPPISSCTGCGMVQYSSINSSRLLPSAFALVMFFTVHSLLLKAIGLRVAWARGEYH